MNKITPININIHIFHIIVVGLFTGVSGKFKNYILVLYDLIEGFSLFYR